MTIIYRGHETTSGAAVSQAAVYAQGKNILQAGTGLSVTNDDAADTQTVALKIWTGTATQFAALTREADTLYLVSG